MDRWAQAQRREKAHNLHQNKNTLKRSLGKDVLFCMCFTLPLKTRGACLKYHLHLPAHLITTQFYRPLFPGRKLATISILYAFVLYNLECFCLDFTFKSTENHWFLIMVSCISKKNVKLNKVNFIHIPIPSGLIPSGTFFRKSPFGENFSFLEVWKAKVFVSLWKLPKWLNKIFSNA